MGGGAERSGRAARDREGLTQTTLMPTIRIATVIDAPPERCFDLARDVDAHLRSTARTGERTVSGVTVDLFDLEDEVTWEARHVGVRRRLTAMRRFPRTSCESAQANGEIPKGGGAASSLR